MLDDYDNFDERVGKSRENVTDGLDVIMHA